MERDERDKLIAQAYLGDENTDPVSAEQLARNYSLSLPMIRKILAAQGAVRKDNPEGKERVRSGPKVISPGHLKIGANLYFSRQMDKINDREQAAQRLGWSVNKLARVEKGVYDLTLTDLVDIAAYRKVPLAEIVKDL